jgi:general stress protein 26
MNDVLTKRDEALAFLWGHTTGTLATVSSEGRPHARLVYYTCDDSFNIYFITLANTRKAQDLTADPRAAFAVAEVETPKTLQMEGTVADLTDTATIDPVLANLVEVLMSNKNYGAPLTRFDTSALKFYRLTPDWVRWGDFTHGYGSDAVLTQIDPKKEEKGV